jgi:plastocyanin
VSLRIPVFVALVAGAAALLLPGAAVSRSGAAVSRSALQNDLVASVGPGFTISLKKSDGSIVSHLDAGSYTITVHDLSEEHNFHLKGSGVDQATGVEAEGDATWQVTFTDAKYTFNCDAHPTQMKGSFTVGTFTSPPPPPPPAKAKKLLGTVGPGYTISLKTSAGKRASKVKAGTYKITVRDRSRFHDFHLLGPGANKRTGVPFKGTKTWTVRLQKGKTYRYRCDVHASRMKGSLRAT